MDGEGIGAACEPEFLDHEWEAGDVIGVLMGEDDGGDFRERECGLLEALDNVATAVDDEDGAWVAEGEHGGGAMGIGDGGAGAEEGEGGQG